MPERRLMLAILVDAVECLQKYRNARQLHLRSLYEEAEAWMTTREAPTPGRDDRWFSFEYVCDVLGFDAAAVRDHARRRP